MEERNITRKSTETKERIKNAAFKSFIARGYHETSMQAIADEIGVNKATLYFYFKSKCNLYLFVLQEKLSLFQDVVGKVIVDSQNENIQKILAHVLSAFTHVSSRDVMLLWKRTILMLYGELEDDVRDGAWLILQKATGEIFDRITSTVSQRFPHIEQERLDSFIISYQLFIHSVSDWIMFYTHFMQVNEEEMIAAMWHVFWYGNKLD